MAYKLLRAVFRYRWMASFCLVLLLDVGTYMALSKTEGQALFDNQDKLLHVLAFFGFYILGHFSLNLDFFPGIKKFSYTITLMNWIMWSAYGAFIELAQKYFTSRHGSLNDFIADLVGISLGTVFVSVFKLYPRAGDPKTQ